MSKRPTKDYGGGLSVFKTNIEPHPAGPPRHGEFGQAERAFTLASTFLSGVLAIVASQFIGAPLKLIDPVFYDAYMAYTKESFAVLITSLTQWWAPTVVRVSGDASVSGQLIQAKDGSLECRFPERLVLMANHQLYTDWLYLWWIAYTNRMHGRIYIILKESLKNIPIIGWGCQFYNFIFLTRKWETDMPTFRHALSHLKKATDPMWLLIFPEGTNLSATTREKSKSWANKNGLQDMKHQLLPRSTGLRFCLQELSGTTEWLYDCTIAYEGVPSGQFGQDIFTLRSSFLEGRPPKSVNMHWRRFKIADIPINSSKSFDVWLRNRWREKDYMLEYFFRHRRFPAEAYWKGQLADANSEKASSVSFRSVARPARTIETEVKSGKFEEFLRIFAPITALAMALFLAYGASPDQLPFPNGGEFLQQHLGALVGNLSLPTSEGGIEKMLEAGPKLPTEPKGLTLGNTPEDKAKQQKYLQLFKDSLPPEVSLEAEQRRRVQSFLNSLPSSEEAQRAATSGAKAPFAERKTRKSLEPPKAATVTGNPSPALSGPMPVRQTAHSVQEAAVGRPTVAGSSSTKEEARYTVLNGVRIKILPSKQEDPPENVPKAVAQFVETKNGMRIKQSVPSTASTVSNTPNKVPEQAENYLQTKSGVRIKQSTPSVQTSESKPKINVRPAPSLPQPSTKSKPTTTKSSFSRPITKRSVMNRGDVKSATPQSKAAAKRSPVAQATEGKSSTPKTTNQSTAPRMVMTSSGPRKLQT